MKKTKTQAFANLIGSLIFIAVGVWALIQTYSFQEVKNTYVQAAVFPQIMCVGMLIFAVILLIQSIIKLMTMMKTIRWPNRLRASISSRIRAFWPRCL